MKKRFLSISLLCCLFGPPAVLYTYWWTQKITVQKAVRAQLVQGMPREALKLIQVAVKDAPRLIHWEKEDEFAFGQQMYDVVTSFRRGDTLYYRCWQDGQETALRDQMHALIAESLEQDQPCRDNKAQLFVFFKSLFCAAPPSLTWALGDFLPEPQSPVFFYRLPRAQGRAAPPGPPPECICTNV